MTTQPDSAVPGRNLRRGWPRPGAPENELPVAVALNIVLARTSDVAMFLGDCWVYSTGFQFTLAARFRTLGGGQHIRGLYHWTKEKGGFLLGVEFADGRTVSTMQIAGGPATVASDADPQLTFHGAGGGLYRFDQRAFLRPMPPAGPLTVIVESLALGIPETRTQVPTDGILTAATSVLELWPYEPPEDVGLGMIAREDLTPGGWFAAHYPDVGDVQQG